jgi:hypothetical protein
MAPLPDPARIRTAAKFRPHGRRAEDLWRPPASVCCSSVTNGSSLLVRPQVANVGRIRLSAEGEDALGSPLWLAPELIREKHRNMPHRTSLSAQQRWPVPARSHGTL